eukprot:jgi/Botrbrau1/20683/Bobra.0058s0013.1
MPWQRVLMSQPPVPGSRYTRTYICEVWHFECCSSPVIAVFEESPYWNWESKPLSSTVLHRSQYPHLKTGGLCVCGSQHCCLFLETINKAGA